MTGGRDPKTKFRKVYQEVDDVPAFEPVTKFNATIDDVSRIPDMVRQAFRVATSGTPGPVHLQFRGNEGQIDLEEADMEPLVEPLFARVPPFRPEPDSASVLAALKVLQEAARPVIVAGGGVRASGAGAELVALAERLGIPVATSLNGKDTIPGTHPLSVGVVGTYSRESANRVVAQADTVCFIGTETGGMTTHFWAVPKIGVAAVQIDIEPQALGRNYPLKAAVLGDAKVALARMLAHANADTSGRRKAWVEQAQGICREYREKYAALLDLRRRADPTRAHVRRPHQAHARGCHRGGRHRPCRHVDGRHVRSAEPRPELHAQRRASGLGLPRRHRRQGRLPRPAGGGVHGRCRLLLPPGRGGDGRALGHRLGDDRQQQPQRQPVQARLRPRLRR